MLRERSTTIGSPRSQHAVSVPITFRELLRHGRQLQELLSSGSKKSKAAKPESRASAKFPPPDSAATPGNSRTRWPLSGQNLHTCQAALPSAQTTADTARLWLCIGRCCDCDRTPLAAPPCRFDESSHDRRGSPATDNLAASAQSSKNHKCQVHPLVQVQGNGSPSGSGSHGGQKHCPKPEIQAQVARAASGSLNPTCNHAREAVAP